MKRRFDSLIPAVASGGKPGQDLWSVLHHHAFGQGNETGPLDLLCHHQPTSGKDRGKQRGWGRIHLGGKAACDGGRGVWIPVKSNENVTERRLLGQKI